VRERSYDQALCREIGQLLKEARKARGIKQETVAKHVGINRSNVSFAESGTSRLPVDRLIRWALFVGLDPAEMVTQILEKHPELREMKEKAT
jgi:transcriptional regulator with XRE-family HTH domain